jgi:hypothetical protein
MAPTLGVDIVQVVVRDADEIEPAIDAFVHEAGGGLIVFPTPVLSNNRGRVIAHANLHRCRRFPPCASMFSTAA